MSIVSQSVGRKLAFESGSSTRGIKKYPTSNLLASSARLGWSTLFVELRSHEGMEASIAVPQYVEICVVIEGNENALMSRKGGDQVRHAVPKSGTIWLNPVGPGDEIRISAPIPKLMHLYLPTSMFRRLSDEFNLPYVPGPSIRNMAAFQDEVIHNVALSLLSEIIHETAAGRMYAEMASSMLAGHIIQRYSDYGSAGPRLNLSNTLDYVRLRRVLDYMEDHISDQITLEELADVACLSTFHFARVFALAVGVPPHRYLSRMRLENAMSALAAGRLPVSEIALRACFSSQASFTRAFRRATGMTPGEYRQRRIAVQVVPFTVTQDRQSSDVH